MAASSAWAAKRILRSGEPPQTFGPPPADQHGPAPSIARLYFGFRRALLGGLRLRFPPAPTMPKTLRSPRQRRLLEVLVRLRAASGLTQALLAERIRRPQSFVAKYENGERRLDVIEFIEIVEAVGGEPAEAFAQLLKSAK